MLNRHVQLTGGNGSHFQGILHSLLARTGIRITGIDDDGLRSTILHPRHADLHWRSTDLVRGKHAGNCSGHLGYDEREIALPALVGALAGPQAFDIAENARRQKTLRREDGTRNFY